MDGMGWNRTVVAGPGQTLVGWSCGCLAAIATGVLEDWLPLNLEELFKLFTY